MPKVTVLWETKQYGATVAVVQRGPMLSLRYVSNSKGTFKALGHKDFTRAKDQARELSRSLANARASESGAPGARRGMTVGELFARYHRDVSAHKKGQQPQEDARRRMLWLAVLGPNRKAAAVTPADVESFIAKRRQGLIVVPGLDLRKTVKPRTIDADVVWLQSVFNWGDRAKLITGQPLKGTLRPDVPTQMRPLVQQDRFAKLMLISEWVHPMFGALLTAVRSLGWRVSAICQIDGRDIRFDPAPHAPHGLIRKNGANDKEGVDAWLPMPATLADALLDAYVPAEGPVFPSERDPERPMSRWRARDLLERAETLAGFDAIKGGDWHPYRRLWATERKGLPVPDVAAAGGWSDQRTLQKYQQLDPATTASVMLYTPAPLTTPRTKPRTSTRRSNADKE